MNVNLASYELVRVVTPQYYRYKLVSPHFPDLILLDAQPERKLIPVALMMALSEGDATHLDFYLQASNYATALRNAGHCRTTAG